MRGWASLRRFGVRGRVQAALLVITIAYVIGFPLVAIAFGDWDGWDWQGHMYGGANTSNERQTSGGMSVDVAIDDFAFRPGNLRIPVGATVRWRNADNAPHTATARDGSWDTGRLGRRESALITFTERGDYAYFCEYHPSMKARLRVG